MPIFRMLAEKRSRRRFRPSEPMDGAAGRQAVLNKDKARREELVSFRADVSDTATPGSSHSQIVDFQDPDLHRRAILATLG